MVLILSVTNRFIKRKIESKTITKDIYQNKKEGLKNIDISFITSPPQHLNI